MSSLRGYCGIDCGECDAYIATINRDEALKARTAEQWSKELGIEMKPGELTCLGCKSNVNTKYCGECPIRSCNETKGIEICADCKDYPCERIESFLNQMPQVRTLLDQLNEIRRRFSK